MIDYCSVPIVILCKDRVRYLDTELKSITATCPTSINVFLSNDGTTNANMLRYLGTNETVPLDDDWKFPEDNKEWNRLIGVIPNPDHTQGIKGKTRQILHARSAGTKNLGLAVKQVFEETSAEYVIKMEDDLVFTPRWYFTLIRAIIHSPCDLISGFRYFYGHPEREAYNDLVEIVTKGYTGGQLMICSRRFFNRCNRVFNNEILTIWDNDDLWINECRKNGMLFGVTTKSVCQHIGYATESKQKAFTKNGKLLKVDREVHSLCFGASVAIFGNRFAHE